MLAKLVARLEALFFGHRVATLGVLAAITVVMAVFAAQLRMSAGFDKQLPQQHEFIKTFNQYRDVLFGANRIIVVVHAKKGDIWNEKGLTKLYEVTQELFFMPGIDRRTVTSLWTPNTRAVQITEEGMKAEDVIGGDVTVKALTPQAIDGIRERTIVGGFVGSLVANDDSGAMVVGELADPDPRTGERLDYLDFSKRLESGIRDKFADQDHDIQIIGFAKQMGDIAEGATGVIEFFGLAFVLTAAAVFLYTRSWVLTILPLVCSLVSVVWQFGTITLLGFGLDPLAILVPFLVFAIGVSHGIQQINYISKEVCNGADAMTAARRSFTGLLVPGSLALITAFVGFATLVLVPIPMIRELAITASVGVAYKIVTNLIMLPVMASFFHFDAKYVERVSRSRALRTRAMAALGGLAETRNAVIGTLIGAALLGLAIWQSQGRHVGHVLPGAPELHDDSRYNRDVESVVQRFGLGLDLLTVPVEAAKDGCYRYEVMAYLDRLTWYLTNVPGVLSAQSLPVLTKLANSGVNEGNPKWAALPREELTLGEAVRQVPEGMRLFNAECTVLPVNLYLADHKASTIKAVVEAVQRFRREHPAGQGVSVRLASGNAGVQAATNEVVETSELPMMLYVYLTILVLVFVVYRDWRAMLACCLPLTLATFLGYWFMKGLDIGLTVATLPVMVLAVGIGVDYAFYIYNRLQLHLAHGENIVVAFKQALQEVGIATIFTAITLSVGVATWSFSALKFQADMGLLLTFMFMINMVMAITLLTALAVTIDVLIPRRRPVKAPFMAH